MIDDIATNSAISVLVNDNSEQKGRLNYLVSQKCRYVHVYMHISSTYMYY